MITTAAPPVLTGAGSSLHLVPAGPELWRVVDGDGRIVGHVQRLVDDGDPRYRALRYQPSRRAFRTVGDFWTAADAVDCLRLGG
ncbi:hypothetical protein ACFVR6_04370 [Microbacterium sp. NPDC058021]|jgi:hypothetical protein|uniref:hypothetical protein n=1 Tax=Microbacterium sp. NPDC058021 TaxID=3346306 RepID=UPI0036DEBB8A